MKRLMILAMIAVAAQGFAQAPDNLQSAGSDTQLVREYWEGPATLVSKDYKYSFSKPAVGHKGTYKRLGSSGEYGWNHYRKSGQFKYESLAGRMLICDRETDTPMQILDCNNLLWICSVKTETRTLTFARTKVREFERRVPYPVPGAPYAVPGPTEYVDRPVLYPVYVLGPQAQYGGQFGAPTVISPTLNGIPGYYNSRVSANGGTGLGGAGGTGGAGGGGGSSSASAAAAAAAAAAATGGH